MNRTKFYIAGLLVALFLGSCVPVQKTEKKRNKDASQSTRAVGHDLEVLLRKDTKGTVLARLVRKKMDRYDREQLNHVFERGLSGRTSSWTNPDKENRYRITLLPAYQTIGKSVCRKATMEAMISGTERAGIIRIKACRANNGHWRLSEEK